MAEGLMFPYHHFCSSSQADQCANNPTAQPINSFSPSSRLAQILENCWGVGLRACPEQQIQLCIVTQGIQMHLHFLQFAKSLSLRLALPRAGSCSLKGFASPASHCFLGFPS